MLYEPERSLVQAWMDAGNVPKRVPFGVGGEAWCFAKVARQSGSYGAFKRYGGLHIEAEAMPYIASGELSAAQARVGFVWGLLRLRGPLSLTDLSTALHMHRNMVSQVLVELIQMGAVQNLITDGARRLAAADLTRAPHWSDYLQMEAKAA